jgi:hypothetical protein
MITLEDSIEINTTVDQLYEWLMNLDSNFTKWNVNHKKFEKVTGGNSVGDLIYFEQCVGGVWYKIKGEITENEKSVDGFRMQFVTMSGFGTITFIGQRSGTGCRFTHIESFGSKRPLIGGVINTLLFKVLFRKKANFELILSDMKEDNTNLRSLLEGNEMGTGRSKETEEDR